MKSFIIIIDLADEYSITIANAKNQRKAFNMAVEGKDFAGGYKYKIDVNEIPGVSADVIGIVHETFYEKVEV